MFCLAATTAAIICHAASARCSHAMACLQVACPSIVVHVCYTLNTTHPLLQNNV